LANPSLRLKIVFLCSITFCLAVIVFAGHAIADFVVSKGIVLQYF